MGAQWYVIGLRARNSLSIPSLDIESEGHCSGNRVCMPCNNVPGAGLRRAALANDTFRFWIRNLKPKRLRLAEQLDAAVCVCEAAR